jgi:hypothetical protein
VEALAGPSVFINLMAYLQTCMEYRQYLKVAGVKPELVRLFRDRDIMGDEQQRIVDGRTVKYVLVPHWWSPKMRDLMRIIEERVQRHATFKSRGRRGPKRLPRYYPEEDEGASNAASTYFPLYMPRDLVADRFLSLHSAGEIRHYHLQGPILPANISSIFPETAADIFSDYSATDEEIQKASNNNSDGSFAIDEEEDVLEDIEEDNEQQSDEADTMMEDYRMKQESDSDMEL